MKGILLAGGTGTRLHPLTLTTNKHLLPVGKKQMILHPLEKLVEAGVTDILVVTSAEHLGDVVALLGSGGKYGASLTYRTQDQPDGIAGALRLASDFVGTEKCAVVLGDNIFDFDLACDVSLFEKKEGSHCHLFLKEVEHPERFGVAKFNSDGKISALVEKPAIPPSNWAVIGVYFYTADVFERLAQLHLSARNEFEITELNDGYIADGLADVTMLTDEMSWTDAGTFSSLFAANSLAMGKKMTSTLGAYKMLGKNLIPGDMINVLDSRSLTHTTWKKYQQVVGEFSTIDFLIFKVEEISDQIVLHVREVNDVRNVWKIHAFQNTKFCVTEKYEPVIVRPPVEKEKFPRFWERGETWSFRSGNLNIDKDRHEVSFLIGCAFNEFVKSRLEDGQHFFLTGNAALQNEDFRKKLESEMIFYVLDNGNTHFYVAHCPDIEIINSPSLILPLVFQ